YRSYRARHRRSQRTCAERADHRFEDHASIVAAERWLARALGMRHHSHDVSRVIADAGNRVDGTVRIGFVGFLTTVRHVSEHHLTVLFESKKILRRDEVVAFPVGNRNPEHLPAFAGSREGRVDLLDANMNVLAAELQAAVS